MRIALDGRFYRASTGGIGRYTRELVKNLLASPSRHEYFLLLTPADAAECSLEANNFHKVVTPIKHFSLAEQFKLKRDLSQLKPDLTHFLNFNHPLNYRQPFITTIHDLTMNFFPVGRQKIPGLRQAYLKVMKHAATAADAVIVPTEAVKHDLITHLRALPEKVTVIYEGVEIPSSVARVKKTLLSQLGIRKPYLLFVSQWRPHKGLGMLNAAFEMIKKEHDVQLVVTGEANRQFPEILANLNNSQYRDDIITPGFVDDELLDTLYAGAKLFVFPSWYEGFGLPPLEAMARGVPVVASNTSVMPEILGDAAAYFDPRDPKEIARTINHLLHNPKLLKDYEILGLKQAAQYSWQKMARETLDLYEKIAARR